MSRSISRQIMTSFDIDLFRAGKHFRLFEKLGAHTDTVDGVKGVHFAVYAPAASKVEVIGDFNFWNGSEHPLFVHWDGSGVWEGFLPDAAIGMRYKYRITNASSGHVFEKGDPFARCWETPPNTATIIWEDDYKWSDKTWMNKRGKLQSHNAPLTVYEVHPGSWRYNSESGKPLSWLELSEQLPVYAKEMGFTHVEFMPVMEYPYDPSWGYQLVGYFAPTSRFGSPQDFKSLVNELHKQNVGVILDWVPSHFPDDAHGLGLFDGSHVYEHPDRRRGYHPDWKSLIFNYGRPEVQSFLISNAIFWLEQFHADGLRVDAVASMLYLDYSREHGEWEPNIYGGRENLEAIHFMKELNKAVYLNFPDVQTIAEESTAFPQVTKPIDFGGLGFGMKWMMGWMNDTLRYFSKDPIHRRYHQNDVTFSLAYVFTENFMLPLSHDEVVHGKQSLLGKMPGDEWQRFANLRLLFAYMYGHPGSKLIFQGGEFGQSSEWKFDQSLDWHLLEYAPHQGVQEYVKALNKLYSKRTELHELCYLPEGFEWIDFNDAENSVISFIRKNKAGQQLIVVLNFTPTVKENYRIGAPELPSISGWKEILNSDAKKFGGSGVSNKGTIEVEPTGWQGRSGSLQLRIPPLGAIILEPIQTT
jgi:1,4-alpha-glucan branching enzyme